MNKICIIDNIINFDLMQLDMKRITVIDDFLTKKDIDFSKKNFQQRGHGGAICDIVLKSNEANYIYYFPVTNLTTSKIINEIFNYILKRQISSIVNVSFGFLKDSIEDDILYEMDYICKSMYDNNIFIISSMDNSNKEAYPASLKSTIKISSKSKRSILNVSGKNIEFDKIKILVNWMGERRWIESNSFLSPIVSSYLSTIESLNKYNLIDVLKGIENKNIISKNIDYRRSDIY